MIRGVHHTSITTCDLDRMLRFYRDLLGLRQVLDTQIADNPAFDQVVGLEGARARGVFLQAGNTFIEFWQYAAPLGKPPIENRPACDAGLTHLCFDIEDVEAIYAKLAPAGVPFLSPPKHLGSVITCYIRDPDGNIIELRQGISGVSTLELSRDVLAASQAILSQ
jgi:catechol 2,3-dioxygenase-like lactoylglutathione lyase family enzyme